MTTLHPMNGPRTYLVVPYDQVPKAKKLGAWWDSVRGQWCVPTRAIAEHPGVYQWIADDPKLKASAKAAHSFMVKHGSKLSDPKSSRKPRKDRRKAPAVIEPVRKPDRFTETTKQTSFLLPQRSCNCAPWDDCAHSRTAQRPPASQRGT